MKTIKHVGGPYLNVPGVPTYQPEMPTPSCRNPSHGEEFSRVAEHIQPEAMCFIGSSLVSVSPGDIDILVLLGEGTNLRDVSIPTGYKLTSPDNKPSPEADVLYPDYLRCFRCGVYNLILTNDRELFRDFRAASLLMQQLSKEDELLRMAFLSKPSRVAFYKHMGIGYDE